MYQQSGFRRFVEFCPTYLFSMLVAGRPGKDALVRKPAETTACATGFRIHTEGLRPSEHAERLCSCLCFWVITVSNRF